jgi:hypothetical protein
MIRKRSKSKTTWQRRCVFSRVACRFASSRFVTRHPSTYFRFVTPLLFLPPTFPPPLPPLPFSGAFRLPTVEDTTVAAPKNVSRRFCELFPCACKRKVSVPSLRMYCMRKQRVCDVFVRVTSTPVNVTSTGNATYITSSVLDQEQ